MKWDPRYAVFGMYAFGGIAHMILDHQGIGMAFWFTLLPLGIALWLYNYLSR